MKKQKAYKQSAEKRDEKMNTSGILAECLSIEQAGRKNATHFVVCNSNKIRYIIALKEGKSRLSANIKPYSGKLYLLMELINIFPLQLFRVVKLGYFAKVVPCKAIQRSLDRTGTIYWNVIVGTYDEKQKLVFQCFADHKKTKYVKVGNRNTEVEMRTEIDYLKKDHSNEDFIVPKLVAYELRNASCPFNIQITEEFTGEKIEPILTEDIIKLYQSVCCKEPMFSHGDFAPWNIRKDGNKYILFDWEHCGKRIQGFDLMHYIVVVQVMLSNIEEHAAFENGLIEIRKFIPDFDLDEREFFAEYHKLRLEG